MVLLGAASVILGMDYDKLEDAVSRVFMRKSENVVEMNKKALSIGRAAAERQVTPPQKGRAVKF
jgi:indolepyruvate ferredoxin oxidoreductase beta subunit